MKNAVETIKKHLSKTISKANTALSDTRGDLATNTIGGIIVAVVIVGLLIVAVNAFFPGFFTDMFNKMAQKLNSNW